MEAVIETEASVRGRYEPSSAETLAALLASSRRDSGEGRKMRSAIDIIAQHPNKVFERIERSGYDLQYGGPEPLLVRKPGEQVDLVLAQEMLIESRRAGLLVGQAQFVMRDAFYASAFDTRIEAEHKRQGLATAMYVLAEIILNRLLLPSAWLSPDAINFWNAPNRPFGRWGIGGHQAEGCPRRD